MEDSNYNESSSEQVELTVSKSETKLNLEVDKKTYTYGDRIIFTVKPEEKTESKINSNTGLSNADYVNFYYSNGDSRIKLNEDPINVSEGVTKKFGYSTLDKMIPIGSNLKLIVEYIGNTNLLSTEEMTEISLGAKQLTATVFEGTSKIYDGTNLFNNKIGRAHV